METKQDKTPEDPDSFDRQIQHSELRRRLINLARRRDVPEADCEDVASDIIAEAIRCQAEYDPQRGSVSTWIIAIGENIIRSYFRGLNAQKRKPEGGIISSDAASHADGNPLEVGDKRTEDERKASEWVEHFVDTADLSEKERKAIALHQDKEVNDTTLKLSSAARRAMEKIKQAGTDEKFRESPQGPAASECAYGQIPAAERSAAVLFDQLRRTPWFVRAIADWRNSPEWKDVQAFLDNERSAKRFPLTIRRHHWPEQLFRYRQAAHDRNPVLRRRFEAAIEIALTFSKWPAVGYCQLAAQERRKRLEEFGWTFGAEPFCEVTKPMFQIFVEAAAETQQSIRSLDDVSEFLDKSPNAASDCYLSTHLVEIDWRYPMKTIIASFKRWAAKQPKGDLGRMTQAGRPATTNLVGFACIRLIDDFGLPLDQAMSWLKERYAGRIPKTPERLERALKATREELKDFLPSPAEIGA